MSMQSFFNVSMHIEKKKSFSSSVSDLFRNSWRLMWTDIECTTRIFCSGIMRVEQQACVDALVILSDSWFKSIFYLPLVWTSPHICSSPPGRWLLLFRFCCNVSYSAVLLTVWAGAAPLHLLVMMKYVLSSERCGHASRQLHCNLCGLHSGQSDSSYRRQSGVRPSCFRGEEVTSSTETKDPSSEDWIVNSDGLKDPFLRCTEL